MKATIAIEGDEKTCYSAFIYGEVNPFTFGVFGLGDTIEEVKEDFANSWEEMREIYNEQGKPFPENVEFEFIMID